MAPSASCPVFMDIHCHGAYEFDTNDAKPEGLRYWAKHIVSEGVTSFLATTVTQSVEVLTNAVANVADVMEGSYEGAEILGIHFEGPYLDMKYKGRTASGYIAKPSVEQFKHYQQAARGHIRYVTLAPEHDEGFALTHYLTEHGAVVSIGHSAATYEQAVMAYANGARSMTHVYNGMSPLRPPRQRSGGRSLPHPHHVRRDHLRRLPLHPCCPEQLLHEQRPGLRHHDLGCPDGQKGTPLAASTSLAATISPSTRTAAPIWTTARWPVPLNINKRACAFWWRRPWCPFNYALNACTINPARCLPSGRPQGFHPDRQGCRPCGAGRQLRCAADLLHGQGPAVISG